MPPTGWIEFKDRTAEQNLIHDAIVGAMPKFRIIASATGESTTDEPKVVLNSLWAHPKVVDLLGWKFTRFHQLTGSCVGAGGGNATFTMNCIEVLKFGQSEKLHLPLWLLNYGKSRQRGGLNGQGEGSFGSSFAESLIKDGVTYATYADAPKYKNDDGVVYTSQIEMTWSNGAAIPAKYLTESKQHPVKTAARVTTTEQIRDAIRNGYPITIATPWFINKGKVKGSGENAAVVGALDTNGGHQTSIQGYWDNPELGPLFLNQNNWPASVYPPDPQGVCPPCSVWQTEAELSQKLHAGDCEVYALSGYEGYPEQSLPKELFMLI